MNKSDMNDIITAIYSIIALLISMTFITALILIPIGLSYMIMYDHTDKKYIKGKRMLITSTSIVSAILILPIIIIRILMK
jgi:hypothetical protein